MKTMKTVVVGLNPMPRRFLLPEEVKEILAGDPSRYPWPAPATPSIRRRAEAGEGLELCEDGSWYPWVLTPSDEDES